MKNIFTKSQIAVLAIGVMAKAVLSVGAAELATETTFGDLKASASGLFTNVDGEVGVKQIYSADGVEGILFNGDNPKYAYAYETTSTDTNLVATGFLHEAFPTNDPFNGNYSVIGYNSVGHPTLALDGHPDTTISETNDTYKIYVGTNWYFQSTGLYLGEPRGEWTALEEVTATGGVTAYANIVTTNDFVGTYDVVMSTATDGVADPVAITNLNKFITIKIGDTLYDIPARESGN